MKTKILAMLALLLISISSFAGNDELNFKQSVITQIKYPEFAKTLRLEADVYISFTVNERGEIEVTQCNSISSELMDYVKKELKKINVNTDNEVIGKTFYFKFSFKYQE
ncbi:MAG: hypothetical protein ACOYO1_14425 [Bacteroidales bacterium]